MGPGVQAARGADVLLRLLAGQAFDLRTLDLGGFRDWLAHRLAFWQRDRVFVQRTRIRELRRAHPELRGLEEAHSRATAADAATPQAARLRELEWELANAARAVEGLTRTLETAPPEKRPALQQKLDHFRETVRALEAKRTELTRWSPERQALLRAAADLEALRRAIGLDVEEVRLADLLLDRGHGTGRAGESFEEQALAVTRHVILPELAAGRDPAVPHILRRATLGAADVEFDQLVIDPTKQPVEVLAAVEAKRNANDLGHGFHRRQQNLAWLTGDTAAYDPAAHRTRSFPAGHFDRPTTHREDHEEFRFGPGSFRRFTRDPGSGFFLDGLYLMARPGPLLGVSGAAQARIAARVATDEDWDPEDEVYLRRLFEWCRALSGPPETPDVLRLFAADPAWARQVLLLTSPEDAAR